MTYLDRILSEKHREVEALAQTYEVADLEQKAGAQEPPRNFKEAVQTSSPPRIIAEFKRASPSKGLINPAADAKTVAMQYEAAGAAAISVLTDTPFFKGQLADLAEIRRSVKLPLLRKDFIIDPLQVIEGRLWGADAILLIVAALTDEQLKTLIDLTHSYQMAALVEVHDANEVHRAKKAGAQIVGINNRDLRSFETSIETTRTLLPICSDLVVVSESGLDQPSAIDDLQQRGAHAFLVGEALMKQPHQGQALSKLRGVAT